LLGLDTCQFLWKLQGSSIVTTNNKGLQGRGIKGKGEIKEIETKERTIRVL